MTGMGHSLTNRRPREEAVAVCRSIIEEYVDWQDPRGLSPKERSLEPFLGNYRAEQVAVAFLGINPGDQTGPVLRTPEEMVRRAGEYFSSPEMIANEDVWSFYGYFFPQSPAQVDGKLQGPTLRSALAIQSVVTNLIHRPTPGLKDLKRLGRKNLEAWMQRGGRHVERILVLSRPELVVVQQTDAFRWLWQRIEPSDRPWDRPPAFMALWRERRQTGQPPLFRARLLIDGLPADYRPFIVPVLHLSRFRYDWLRPLYRKVAEQVVWTKS